MYADSPPHAGRCVYVFFQCFFSFFQFFSECFFRCFFCGGMFHHSRQKKGKKKPAPVKVRASSYLLSLRFNSANDCA